MKVPNIVLIEKANNSRKMGRFFNGTFLALIILLIRSKRVGPEQETALYF